MSRFLKNLKVNFLKIFLELKFEKSTENKIWKFLYLTKGDQTQDRPYFMISLIPSQHDIVSDGRPPFELGFAYDSFYSEANFDYEEYDLEYGEVNTHELEDRLLKPGEILTVKYETVEFQESGMKYGAVYYGLDIGDNESLLIQGFDMIPIDNGEMYTIVASFHEAAMGETLQMLQ